MLVRVEGNTLDTIKAGKIPDNRMAFHSEFPLLDFLYRLEASMPSSGRYTPLTPYEIFLNPLQNDSARALLQRRLHNGVVVPAEGRRAGWPVVNSNAEWLLAATELAMADGDSRWLSTVRRAARTALDNDLRISYNKSTGLFFGIPPYMTSDMGIFPSWMAPADLFQQSSLGVNMAYLAAVNTLELSMGNREENQSAIHERYLPLSADTLRHALKKELWIPNMGYFSAVSYGVPVWQLPLQSTDNLAQAIAVISGNVRPRMGEAIIRKTPVTSSGVELFYPSLPSPGRKPSGNNSRLLLQTAWTAACARTGNEAAYSASLGALFAAEGERLLGHRDRLPAFRSSFSSLILRGLLGIRYSSDGIFLTPYVPENLPGEKRIDNLRYRNSTLDIRITGTGRVISTFTIDGKDADPFFPAGMEGRHKISITLAGASADPGFVSIEEEVPESPLSPAVDWISTRSATIHTGILPVSTADTINRISGQPDDNREDDQEECYLVYIDGILREEIFRKDYNLFDSPKAVGVQFTAFVDSRLSGFSSKPYIYVPPSLRRMIYASQISRTGTKILEDKKLAEKFVESSRFKNRHLRFEFDAPVKGRYLVDVHYASGLGIVNRQRKTALRQLRVDNRPEGIFIFPQQAAVAEPGKNEKSWQQMTAWSNTLAVELEKGVNHLELRYFQPSPVYVDPTANDILFDMIRFIPAD